MAPKTSDANLFLKAPNIFKIEYFNKGQQHTGINLIKDCALQSCTVNYTPDGTYMSYEDGAMFSYDLQLQFMELIPVYAKDYNEGDGAKSPNRILINGKLLHSRSKYCIYLKRS